MTARIDTKAFIVALQAVSRGTAQAEIEQLAPLFQLLLPDSDKRDAMVRVLDCLLVKIYSEGFHNGFSQGCKLYERL